MFKSARRHHPKHVLAVCSERDLQSTVHVLFEKHEADFQQSGSQFKQEAGQYCYADSFRPNGHGFQVSGQAVDLA